MRKLIAIVGPTASGKTALAIDLAQRLQGEIVGADSRQVYRHMDIGTAKPTAQEQAAARHHLIDIVEPDEPFSLGRWLERANEALGEIWSRGKQPLLVGGTGQYIWALLEGWQVPRVPPQNGLREDLTSRPLEDLLAELRRVDPEAEAFVDPSNVRRVVRALEVYHATGKPFSFWRTKEPPPFESTVIGMRLPREELYRRIDERVEAMFAGGLVEEVGAAVGDGIRTRPAVDVRNRLPGGLRVPRWGDRPRSGDRADEDESTHRFARHQNSWFKPNDERIRWVEVGTQAVEEALRDVKATTRIHLALTTAPYNCSRSGQAKERLTVRIKDPGTVRFTGTIEPATFPSGDSCVAFPQGLKNLYGVGNWVPVVATVDKIGFRSSRRNRGWFVRRPVLPIPTRIRRKLRKRTGDTVEVTVTLNREGQ